MLKVILIFICVMFFSNSFAQLKAYENTTGIKDTIIAEDYLAPEISAEFPGGANKMTRYFLENFMNKLAITQDDLVIFKSPAVSWTVDDTGKVVDVKIIKSSNISNVDNLLLDVTVKMPLWRPAENAGKKVKQVFKIPMNICFK